MSDEELERSEPTGGLRAPRRASRRILWLVGGVVVAVATMLAVSNLPDDTARGSLVVRGLVGLGIGLVLIFVVRRMLGALAEPRPAPPARVDAREVDVVYECALCGTRLRLEVAATGKPPKHCGEEMEPRLEAGR